MNEKELEEKRKEFDERQKVIDEKYLKDGLTDEVLDLQVQLNIERHELDITDDRQRINGQYVQ